MPGRLDRGGQSGSGDRIFADALGLAELGFRGVEPEVTGRPSYHPSVLLKLYIYGYLNRVQSSRRLEREARRNVEVMWLTAFGRLIADQQWLRSGMAARLGLCGRTGLCMNSPCFTRRDPSARELGPRRMRVSRR